MNSEVLDSSPAYLDRWILSRREPRASMDPWRAYASLVEEERSADGQIVPIATVFLTNRECPFRCLMCDLWKNTLAETVPLGAIPAQIRGALAELPPARQIKLYNSGSFFDPHAIPPGDYPAIAATIQRFERVIVECHPALIGQRCLSFQQQIASPLEVAIGLETAHPEVLKKLNKRMTVESLARAAAFLREHSISLRVFVLLRPPFMSEDEGLEWALRSVEFAFDCGASACTIIPTRAGNGAMDELAAAGHFAPPTLAALEQAHAAAIGFGRGRVFVDLWDIKRLKQCEDCFPERVNRMQTMNLQQIVLPNVSCRTCRNCD